MKYTVELKGSAAKALRKLPRSAQKRIVAKLTEFESSFPPAEETKLKGNNPFHRVRVRIPAGNYHQNRYTLTSKTGFVLPLKPEVSYHPNRFVLPASLKTHRILSKIYPHLFDRLP